MQNIDRATGEFVLFTKPSSGNPVERFNISGSVDCADAFFTNANFSVKKDNSTFHGRVLLADALYVINSRDGANSFFYCDPPYYNSNLGHYNGYSEQDFENLLKLLSKIEGKFLLSSYPSALLDKYTIKFKWHNKKIEQRVTAAGADKGLKKIEVLTANYKI